MKKQKTQKKIPARVRMLGWIPATLSLLIVLAIAIPLIKFVLPVGSVLSIVDGTSMDSTLHHGQLMFQNGTDFSRGDIVTCTVSENGAEKILVKRIVGMPGETIVIRADGVYINNVRLQEDYLDADKVGGTYREYLNNDVVLSAEEYFLMGDNRPVSYDSRYFGGVKRSDMLYVVSDTPGFPFFLALGIVLLIVAAACLVEIWLDDLLLRFFSRYIPELKLLMDEDKKSDTETTNEQETQ